MENIFMLIEEFNKKLNRPIKDLDDIRIAMAALKEIREQQISIDFQVGPIEVTNDHLFIMEIFYMFDAISWNIDWVWSEVTKWLLNWDNTFNIVDDTEPL